MRADDLRALSTEWLNSNLGAVRECGRRLSLALDIQHPGPKPGDVPDDPNTAERRATPAVELADFEPSDGHIHGCGYRVPFDAPRWRDDGCDCAALLYVLAEYAEVRAATLAYCAAQTEAPRLTEAEREALVASLRVPTKWGDHGKTVLDRMLDGEDAATVMETAPDAPTDEYGRPVPTCPIHGPVPVAAGLPDHPGFSGWGTVQTLDGEWTPCLRCGDCGRVLLVSPGADQRHAALQDAVERALAEAVEWRDRPRGEDGTYANGINVTVHIVREAMAATSPADHRGAS